MQENTSGYFNILYYFGTYQEYFVGIHLSTLFTGPPCKGVMLITVAPPWEREPIIFPYDNQWKHYITWYAHL